MKATIKSWLINDAVGPLNCIAGITPNLGLNFKIYISDFLSAFYYKHLYICYIGIDAIGKLKGISDIIT